MPAILEAWKSDEPTWYHNITSLQIQFFVHLIIDILVYLNKLNYEFQCDHVDITSIASTVDVTITLLRRQYLIGEFGRTSKYLRKFLEDVVPTRQVLYIDRYGVDKVHNLHYESMLGCNVEGLWNSTRYWEQAMYKRLLTTSIIASPIYQLLLELSSSAPSTII